MLILGALLVLLALAFAAVLVLGSRGSDQLVDLTLGGQTLSLSPLALVVASLATMAVLWLGTMLVRLALASRAKKRRQRKEEERAARERLMAREDERIREIEERERALEEQRVSTEIARERAEAAEREAEELRRAQAAPVREEVAPARGEGVTTERVDVAPEPRYVDRHDLDRPLTDDRAVDPRNPARP